MRKLFKHILTLALSRERWLCCYRRSRAEAGSRPTPYG